MIQISHRNQTQEVDLQPVQDHLDKHELVLQAVYNELEMQRRALISLKTQRDIDRSRRLTLLKRIKKEQSQHKEKEFRLKLTVGVSLLISIISIFIKV